MMNKMMKKTTIATLFGATVLFGAAFTANAAQLTSFDKAFTMETPNDNWKEISDKTTIMTLTNGTDYVTVNRFDKEEAMRDPEHVLPMPTVAHDEYVEEFLAYYSTDKDVYVITGIADRVEDIDDVRSIVNSIQLADHKKAEAPKKEEKKSEKKEKKEAEKTGRSFRLENEVGTVVTVYEYTDGSLRSEDKNLFQSVDGNEYVDYYGNHYQLVKDEEKEEEKKESGLVEGQTYTTKVSSGYLALRNAPDTSDNSEFGQLWNGSTVIVTGPQCGDFVPVTVTYTASGEYGDNVDGRCGYVNAKYLF